MVPYHPEEPKDSLSLELYQSWLISDARNSIQVDHMFPRSDLNNPVKSSPYDFELVWVYFKASELLIFHPVLVDFQPAFVSPQIHENVSINLQNR